MANLGEKLIGAGLQYKGAKDQQKAAEAAAAKRMNLIQSLDFTPAYTSDLAPTYKRTESPVARSWIESFLSGNNPDAISPTSPNAAVKKQRAQQSQNAMFGTPQDRVARNRAIEQETPWAVTSPTRNIGPKPEEKTEAQLRTDYADPGAVQSTGFTSELNDAMLAANPKWKGRSTAMQGQYLVKKFGSADAAVEAIKRGDPAAMKYVNYIPMFA